MGFSLISILAFCWAIGYFMIGMIEIRARFGSRPNRGHTIFWIAIAILDSNRRDLLIYHWSPRDQLHSESHLHVGSVILNAAGHEIGKGFSKLHIATGPVSIQQVVRMLIEEFDVQPLNDNWNTLLQTPDTTTF